MSVTDEADHDYVRGNGHMSCEVEPAKESESKAPYFASQLSSWPEAERVWIRERLPTCRATPSNLRKLVWRTTGHLPVNVSVALQMPKVKGT